MFIGTGNWYRCNFINGSYHLKFCRAVDVINHNLDHWRRSRNAFLWSDVNPFCGKDGSDLSTQRVSGAPHFFLCGARSGKGDLCLITY